MIKLKINRQIEELSYQIFSVTAFIKWYWTATHEFGRWTAKDCFTVQKLEVTFQ